MNHRPLHRTLLLAPLLGILPLTAGCKDSPDPTASSADRAARFVEADATRLAELLRPGPGEKALLVNFWATWCGPCVRELPELVELSTERSSDGIRVVAVALDITLPMGDVRTAEGIRAFAEKKGFDLPIVAYTGELRELQEAYGLGNSLPLTIVIDADGEIVARKAGASNRKGFERMLQKAL